MRIITIVLFLIWAVGAQAAEHKVGPAYHLLRGDYFQDQFIRRYHDPAIRETVRAQLAVMAASGATKVRTRLWSVIGEAENASTWNAFPFSTQEMANLRQYAMDVRHTGLELWLTLLWMWCADYSSVNDDGTVGACHLTWDRYIGVVRQSFASLAHAARGYVQRVEINGEIMVGARPNEDRFLRDLWPTFQATMAGAGITPSVYFAAAQDEAGVFNPGGDGVYPILTGRTSMYWVYRTTEFLRLQVPSYTLPSRIDISIYPNVVRTTYDEYVEKVVQDFSEVYPGHTLGVAETYYAAAVGRAFVTALERRGWPVVVSFWPVAPGGAMVLPPYDLEPYLPMSARPTVVQTARRAVTPSTSGPSWGSQVSRMRVTTSAEATLIVIPR